MSQSKKPRVAVTKDSRGHIHIRLNAGLKATLGRGAVKAKDGGTTFKAGDYVTATVNAQGLTVGQRYRIKSVNQQRLAFGTYVTYTLESGQVIGNGHMVLKACDAVPPKKPDEGGKYNFEAVQKAINKDPRIKGKEAKLIHALLKGHGDAKDEYSWHVKLEKAGKQSTVLIRANSEGGAEREAQRTNPGAKILSITSSGGAERKMGDAKGCGCKK